MRAFVDLVQKKGGREILLTNMLAEPDETDMAS